MNTKTTTGRSQAWFTKGCRYFALRQLTGVEVLPPQHVASVQVTRTTLHGTPAELRRLAVQLVRAADLAEAGA